MIQSTVKWFLPLVVLSTGILSVPVMMFSDKGLARLRSLEYEVERAKKANSVKEVAIVGLKREVKALRDDPRLIEKSARNNLGLVRKGEVVFHFQP